MLVVLLFHVIFILSISFNLIWLFRYREDNDDVISSSLFLRRITAIQQEKSQVELIDGIEGFNRRSLKHAETVEKNPLPTKETIDQVKN